MEPTFVTDLVDGDLVGGTVVRQPGDHSCLYHSICFFLNRMYSTLSYTPLLLRSEINSFIVNHRSSMLSLGPGSLYTVAECVFMEHYTIERYVTFMSKSSSWGGIIELACLVHMYPVDIYVFQPDVGSGLMKWISTFATILPRRPRVNNIYLLYTGNNHYDCILDAVFHPRYVGSFYDSPTVVDINESSSNMHTGCCAYGYAT